MQLVNFQIALEALLGFPALHIGVLRFPSVTEEMLIAYGLRPWENRKVNELKNYPFILI